MTHEDITRASGILKRSSFTTAYTGAGISVESGIPPFRGDNGIWSKYDPGCLEIGFFLESPAASWQVIKEIFYDFYIGAGPNDAHKVLARMEQGGMIHRVITQNIDNLHQEAGSRAVFEFHGNLKKMLCLACLREYPAKEVNLDHLPPTCRECGGLLKPDFVFFGEGIPRQPLLAAYDAATKSEAFLIIGTTGEVMPANQIPVMAKSNGSVIIEINPVPSNYTDKITDIFLQGKATEVMKALEQELFTAPL